MVSSIIGEDRLAQERPTSHSVALRQKWRIPSVILDVRHASFAGPAKVASLPRLIRQRTLADWYRSGLLVNRLDHSAAELCSRTNAESSTRVLMIVENGRTRHSIRKGRVQGRPAGLAIVTLPTTR